MKKIIFVCSSFAIGGVETSFATLVDYAIPNDVEVELHIVDQNGDITGYIPERVTVKFVNSNIKYLIGRKFKDSILDIFKQFGLGAIVIKVLSYFCAKLRMDTSLWMNKYYFTDISQEICDTCIILKENDPSLFYALRCIKTTNRIVFFHTAKFLKSCYIRYYKSNKVNTIVTVSAGNKNFLLSRMPGVKDKMNVIHNVVPVERIKTLANEPLLSLEFFNDKFPLLYVGRICDEKGIKTVLSAASIVKEQHPELKWYILGPYDKRYTKETFNKLLRNNGLSNTIVPIGSTSNPYPYIKNASVIVNPSLIESFGMVIRESQILGIPVIATKTYGGVELIEDTRTGFLIDIDNPVQLAKMVSSLYSNTDLYEKMRKNLTKRNFDETIKVEEEFRKIL